MYLPLGFTQRHNLLLKEQKCLCQGGAKVQDILSFALVVFLSVNGLNLYVGMEIENQFPVGGLLGIVCLLV